MTIVAEHFDYMVGIDTHARTHTYAIVNTRTGARDGCQTFPVSAAGIHRAVAWIQRLTSGAILAAVEGTRSYGATITHALTDRKSTRLNSSHVSISYAVFCLKKKK